MDTILALHAHTNPGAVNAKDKTKHTPMHRAVLCEHVRAGIALLSLGADPCAVGPMGYTPLHYAARLDQAELIMAMMQVRVSYMYVDLRV